MSTIKIADKEFKLTGELRAPKKGEYYWAGMSGKVNLEQETYGKHESLEPIMVEVKVEAVKPEQTAPEPLPGYEICFRPKQPIGYALRSDLGESDWQWWTNGGWHLANVNRMTSGLFYCRPKPNPAPEPGFEIVSGFGESGEGKQADDRCYRDDGLGAREWMLVNSSDTFQAVVCYARRIKSKRLEFEIFIRTCRGYEELAIHVNSHWHQVTSLESILLGGKHFKRFEGDGKKTTNLHSVREGWWAVFE